MENKKTFLQHLLKAFLIASSISLIVAMIAFNLITGMYAELFNFFLVTGVFLGSIIFYFVFVFFRSRRKLPWLFGGIAVYLLIMIIANAGC